MITTIALIAERKKSSAIAAIIRKPLSSNRSDNERNGISTIAELFFLSDRSDHSDLSDHMETRLKLRIFTKQNTFQ